jgi:hypothetical protein
VTGRAYLGTRPSKKAIRRLTSRVSRMTGRTWTRLDLREQVERINRLLRGWSTYFCLGPVSNAYRAVDRHVRHRLRQWLCGKHQVSGRGTRRYPPDWFSRQQGLVRLSSLTRGFPWATA